MIKKLLEQETHCELSYELIYLLNWLIHHESVTLKKMVQRAVEKKFDQVWYKHDQHGGLSGDQVQYSIVELLELLEHYLQEALQKREEQDASTHEFTQTTQRVDMRGYIPGIVEDSMQKVTKNMHTQTHEQVEALFFKELLKNFKPSKKDVRH